MDLFEAVFDVIRRSTGGETRVGFQVLGRLQCITVVVLDAFAGGAGRHGANGVFM